ncbi:MAG: beta-ketoacyl synthase chain length factor [Acidobacteria bacterium]|nr:beta-ketoacyl synthase chain length factor [Acidobacteriota bacterium]
MSSSSVVITGLGAVCAHGCGREAVARALAGGEPRLMEVDRSPGFHREMGSLQLAGSRLASLVQGVDLKEWLSPMAARRMSPPSKMAVAAAKMAVAEAALEGEALHPAAVYVSTNFGPSTYSEKILEQVFHEGPEAVSPMLFTESVANAPAAQIALAFRAVGPNVTVTQREAGAVLALAGAAREVARGRVPTAVVAAVDEVSTVLHATLDRLKALATPEADGREVARPFDRRRTGFLLSEGASALVLETEESARARGARPLARLRFFASGFDPGSSRVSWSADGRVLADPLKRRLEEAGLDPAAIDRVVCGASGSVAGDRLEAAVLKRLFGEQPLPPLLAPKAVFGEYGIGPLVPAVLATLGEPFGPTPGFEEEDPSLGVRPHDGRPLAVPERVLVSSLASGGAAAWAVLEPADPGRERS